MLHEWHICPFCTLNSRLVLWWSSHVGACRFRSALIICGLYSIGVIFSWISISFRYCTNDTSVLSVLWTVDLCIVWWSLHVGAEGFGVRWLWAGSAVSVFIMFTPADCRLRIITRRVYVIMQKCVLKYIVGFATGTRVPGYPTVMPGTGIEKCLPGTRTIS